MRSEVGVPTIEVDEELFTEQLPRIRDLAELKLVLHVIHLTSTQGKPAVPLAELFDLEIVRSVAGQESAEPATERLLRGVERALANGVLLRLTLQQDGAEKVYLLPATARNRALLDRLRAGDAQAGKELELPPGVGGSIYRPNVFAFYERHIGPLTPLVADQLREAERAYPRAWIEQAILEAVHYNKRSWRYVESILASWEESGAPRSVSGK